MQSEHRNSRVPTTVANGRRGIPLRNWIGWILLAAYAVPLFFPPAAVPLLPPAEDASWVERIFPAVPPWWVLTRLICLAVGLAALWPSLVVENEENVFANLSAQPSRPPATETGIPLTATLIAALSTLVTIFFAGDLGPLGQTLFVASLALPALLTYVGNRGQALGLGIVSKPHALHLALGVAAVWVIVRFAIGLHSHRTANPVDMWLSFRWLNDAINDGVNPLLASGQPGINNMYMVLVGGPFLVAGDIAPTTAWIQRAHAFWLFAAAAVVARLSATLIRGTSPLIAVSVFLFSPFILLMPNCVSPYGIFLFLGAMLVLWSLAFARSASSVALLIYATVAGFSMMTAYLFPMLLLTGIAVAYTFLSARHARPVSVLPAALLVFIAAAWQSFPDYEALLSMFDRYATPHGQWAGLEAVVLGSRSLNEVPTAAELWQAGQPGRFDIAIGAFLSIVASPRTALRLWGDTLFDPIGSVIALVGLVFCLRSVRTSRVPILLVVLLVAATVPAAIASAYDRPSLIRNILLPIPLALLAASGIEALSQSVNALKKAPSHWIMGLGASFVVAISGLWIYDVVNPRILPASSVGLAIESLGPEPSSHSTAILEYGVPARLPWLHVDTIAAGLPKDPIATVPYAGTHSIQDESGSANYDLYFWSTAMERDSSIARAICRLWPQSILFLLRDRPHLTKTLAVNVGGTEWIPDLPPHRFQRGSCGQVEEIANQALRRASL